MRYVSLVTLSVFFLLLTSCGGELSSSFINDITDLRGASPSDDNVSDSDACKLYGFCKDDGGSNGTDTGSDDSGADGGTTDSGPGTTSGGTSGGTTPNPTGDGCDPGAHNFGDVALGGQCDNGKLVPITFVFVNSSSKALSSNVQADADQALDKMNELFRYQGHAHIQFVLKEAKEVVDNTYHNTACNYLSSVSQKYASTDSMVMLFVNDLQGGCAGVSWLWVFPKDSYSVTMAEYRHPFELGKFTPVIHEFAHSFGIHHTGNEYQGSVPMTGLHTFNAVLNRGGRSSRRCQEQFSYFIDPVRRNTSGQAGGLTWNSYHNTMYPSFGGQPDLGFFTEGYDYSMSWAFDCWYKFALNDI